MKRKIFSILFALVLVTGLSLIPVVPAVSANGPNYHTGVLLQVDDKGATADGTAIWVKDSTSTGNYAVHLATGDPDDSEALDAARVVLPYNQALSTITNLGYSYKLMDGNGSPNWDSGPYIVLALDNDDDDTADTWVVHHMFALSSGTGTWLDWELADDPLPSQYMGTGNGTAMWHIAGDNLTANINWADIVSAHGDYTVLEIKIVVGEWTSDINTAHYVDDAQINGVSYDLQPPIFLDAMYYRTGDTVTVTVLDASANTSATTQESVAVTANSTITSHSIMLGLLETGVATGIFTETFTLVNTTPGTGELLVSHGATITVTYGSDDDTAGVDNVAPVIVITSPTASSNITDATPDIEAGYTDVGLSGIDTTSVVMTLDGSPVTATVTGSSANYTPSANLTEGSHAVTVNVSDLAGNAATQKSWSFTVDTIDPAITGQVATPSVVTPSVSANITFTATVADITSGVATVTIDVSSIDTATALPMLNDGDGIYSANITTTITTEATYTLTVTATDEAGNDATADITLVVALDTEEPVITSPAITYLYGLTSARPSDNVTISANVTDNVAVASVVATADTVLTVTLNDLGQGPDVTAGDDIYTGEGTVDGAAAAGDYTITITATDGKSNVDTDTSLTLTVAPAVTGYDITLADGWNLISLPLIPTDGSIDVVLADISDNVSQVRTWVYVAGVLTEKVWAEGGTVGDLTEMVDGRGYWIEMTEANELTITGTELPAPPLTPPSYSVYEGWNLIGFKSVSVSTAEAYLGTAVSLIFERMYGYDAAEGMYTLIILTSDLDPGQGYWLAVSAEGTIYP